MGSEFLKGANAAGVAISLKHFPGDGCDERDQHIVTSINDLTVEEWDESFGKVYQSLINQGAKTVMVGHIAQPAYVEALNSSASAKEQLLPATLSKELLTGLLREKLNFNGLIVTDATLMLGYNCAMNRKEALPASINAGCDMILFNKNIEEDVIILKNAVEKGIL